MTKRQKKFMKTFCMVRHYKIKVFGKVQGVYYRQSTMEKSLELGVKGFVRNEPDGSVYIEAEGSEEQINKLIDWCNTGPPLASVLEIQVSEGELKKYSCFEIRR